ncbi:hypothetical protein [Solitalea longa]|nr:hypothetical protein [Solitalea longa]
MQFIPIVERTSGGCSNGLSLVLPEFSEAAEISSWSVPSLKYGQFMVAILPLRKATYELYGKLTHTSTFSCKYHVQKVVEIQKAQQSLLSFLYKYNKQRQMLKHLPLSFLENIVGA